MNKDSMWLILDRQAGKQASKQASKADMLWMQPLIWSLTTTYVFTMYAAAIS